MPSGMRPHGSKMKLNGKSLFETEEYEASKGKKAKVRDQSPKVNLRARVPRDRLHPGQHNLNLLKKTDLNPKPNPKHALA